MFSEESALKKWADLFANNLSLISNQIFNVKSDVKIEVFNGKLSAAQKHIFILSDKSNNNKVSLAIDKASTYQVHLSPIEYHNIPDFLADVPAFSFYNFDAIKNNSSWSNLDVGTSNSWEKLLDFSKNIHNIYKKDKQTIYLAATSVDQNSNRDKLKQDLLNKGFIVLPEYPLNSTDPNALEKQILSYTKEASLSIHIYGNDTKTYSDQEIDLVDFQNKICAKNEESNLHRLIWLPSNARLNKENQERISLLRKDLELLKGAEFVEAPLEPFKSLTYQKIDTISSVKASKRDGLYLIYDNDKNSDIAKIKAEIETNQFSILEVDNKSDNPLVNHKSNLKNSNGIIIYYDGSNNNWIESILNDIIKTPKFRNNKKINSIGIISNSQLTLKPELETYNLEKIDLSNQSQLKTFIQNINK